MNSRTPNVSHGLYFDEIKSGRHTAKGILSDEKGNTFLVEVKGSRKKDVEKFINYQMSPRRAGKGIQNEIHPLTDDEKAALKKAKKSSKKGPEPSPLPSSEKPYKQKTWKKGISVKITVNRLESAIAQPSKIRFIIDPPVEAGKQIDFPFDDSDTADVRCHVSKGSVNIELFEFTDLIKNTSVSRGTYTGVSAGQDKTFSGVQKQHTGHWNYRVTGASSATSTFTLTLDLSKQ